MVQWHLLALVLILGTFAGIGIVSTINYTVAKIELWKWRREWNSYKADRLAVIARLGEQR